MQIQIKPRKELKTRDEETAFVSFPYDKFILNVIKDFSVRKWHQVQKQWEIEVKDIPTLISVVKNQAIVITCENKRYISDQALEREFTGEVVDFKTKTELFQHQKEAVLYAMTHKRMLLGDEPGLGKTLSFISAAMVLKDMYGYKHALVVCGINTIKWNWVSEIITHTYDQIPYMLGKRKRKNGNIYIGSIDDRLADLKKLPSNYFIITNIETLRDERISKQLSKLCLSGEISIVGVDESHLCSNNEAQQSRGLLELQAENRICMTGTPMNKPLDLWVSLYWLGVEKHNFYQFRAHYSQHNSDHILTGYQHLDELRQDLSRVMLRRLKKDVLDLPEQIFTTVYVEMKDDQRILYENIFEQIKEAIQEIMICPNPLVKMLRLRQVTGTPELLGAGDVSCAKLEYLDSFLEERVTCDRKCVIFSNWKEANRILINRYAKYHPAVINGSVTSEEREKQKNIFNDDPECRILIGTVKSMGVSLTLNAADTVIFLDEPWNYSTLKQCADRVHRIGQSKNVQIVSLLTKFTIDERIHEIIADKKELSDYLVDNKSRAAFLEFLLS